MSGINIDKLKMPARPGYPGRPASGTLESKSTGILDILNKDISFSGKILNDIKRESFYHELSILLSAGVDIKSSLDMIASEQTKAKHKKLFEKIKDNVISGETLSEAIKSTGEFSNYEYFSLQIGEESGKITIVLKELAAYYKSKVKQRRQIISALTYPAIVMLTSFGAIFFMLNFIVPMFADIFKRFGGDLPVVTAVILKISYFFKANILWIILFIGAIILTIYSQSKKTWFRNYSSRLILRTPVIGELVKKIYLARFSYSMNLLIGSKIPILRAIQLVKQMIGFYPIEISLDKVEDSILHGHSLHQSLAQFPVYPSRMISLIKVGEEVNQLELFFEKIAVQFSEEVEHQTTVMSSLIEPFIIIFLGLIVGVILIAMYLPLFQLSTVF